MHVWLINMVQRMKPRVWIKNQSFCTRVTVVTYRESRPLVGLCARSGQERIS